jgi:LmbE family N-acetylglucosaminyl deacetylase
MKKILVIAPHPDDEVLGCGGTIAKQVKDGNHVYLCIATKAYLPDWSVLFLRERKKEIELANHILGISKTFFLNLKTVHLDAYPQKKINDDLEQIVKQIEPETVYIPFGGDLNKDHRIIFESALVALRPTCLSTEILCYETLSETEWGINEFFRPNIYVDISKTLNAKIDAMKAYKSEIKRPPHPRSLDSIRVLAQKRGSEANLSFAEAFVLIRKIVH